MSNQHTAAKDKKAAEEKEKANVKVGIAHQNAKLLEISKKLSAKK